MNFVTIDFETANYSRNSACSVGLVKHVDGKETDTFYSLIRPPKLYIRRDFTKIHGLTADDVRYAPVFADIWDSGIKPFISGFPLAAHNAAFDMGVLRAVLDFFDLDIPKLPFFCTCCLSRRTWPDLKSHSLGRLAESFGIVYNAHNALEDARTCGKLVLLAGEIYGSAGVPQLLKAIKIRMSKLE